jgi:NAD/NADP transhydrogenase beta subunit
MPFLVYCLVAAISLLLPRGWLALYRLDILLAVFFASVGYSTSVHLETSIDEFIGSISGLASQLTARRANIFGILGVTSGILASLLAVGFSPATLTQFGAVAGIGSILGKSLSIRRSGRIF